VDIDYAALRHLLGQWRQIAPCYFGDYWPLTRYSRYEGDWLVWQYDRPNLGEGFVQATVRPGAHFDEGRFKLRGLVPEASYIVGNIDELEKKIKMSGKELMENGLIIKANKKPCAPIFVYRKEILGP